MSDLDNFGELAMREHIRLIMQQEHVDELEATVRAWLEGPKGYVERKWKVSGKAEPAPDPAPVGHNLQGEIKVGDKFIWEPNKPHARCEVRVIQIECPENDERRIWTEIPGSVVNPTWNDESRFREACVRTD